jgi:hypothetical protein
MGWHFWRPVSRRRDDLEVAEAGRERVSAYSLSGCDQQRHQAPIQDFGRQAMPFRDKNWQHLLPVPNQDLDSQQITLMAVLRLQR